MATDPKSRKFRSSAIRSSTSDLGPRISNRQLPTADRRLPTADCACDLCGLPLRSGAAEFETHGKTYRFCCPGCLQVFRMLLQASDHPDPAAFKSTELFEKCRAMGIIPGSEKDLEANQLKEMPPERPNGETLPLHLSISGMWCPSCGWVIDASLAKMPGVFEAVCSFSTDTFRCRYDPVLASPRRIIEHIEKLGYSAGVPDEDKTRLEDRREFIRFAVSALLTMNIMMLSFALYTGFFNQLTRSGIHFISVPIFLIACVVFFYGGARIHRKGLQAPVTGAYGMETLISLGAGCVFFYSVLGLWKGSLHLYFDTSAMLITLVLLGKLLERRAKRSVQADLVHFFSIRPRKVRVCTGPDSEGRYVSVDFLKSGDLFRLEEGEASPADGVVVKGHAIVDESALTGEPVPKNKTAGDSLTSGIMIVSGDLLVKAEHVGEAATLGQMIHLIETALGRKTALESRTDRLLRWFVPGVIGVALLTGGACLAAGLAFETALLRMITVLVISCPCALGIAIPLARVAGISAAGRLGVLVRDMASFDKAGVIDSLIFDKTGTVTLGEWRISEVEVLASCSETFALSLAAGLEANSAHATATAILHLARERDVSPAHIDTVASFENGRSGVFEGKTVKIGSKAFIGGDSVPPGISDRAAAENLAETRSSVYLTLGGETVAIFFFDDGIRPDAAVTMDTLRDMGYRLGMVSGDGEDTTRKVAGRLGISEQWGGRLPREKMDIIKMWQTAGAKVAMVGDGVNDAPALAQSDLAVAMKAGNPLGRETADITLMRGELSQVIDFLRLSGDTRRKIFQNLMFTLLYNAVCIPIAMAGLLSPLIAVGAMLMSSLSVIGNTLMLVRKYRKTARMKSEG